MATLYVYPKQGPPSVLALEKDLVTIGRAADNDVVLTDPFCSSRHAVIFRTPTGFGLRDNGSKNGTYLNGRRLEEPADLRRGDEILVGSARLLYDRPQMADVEVMEIARSTTNVNTAVPSQDMINRPPTGPRSAPLGEADVLSERRLLSVLGEISQALLLHKPLQELLEHIMDLVSEHLPMDRGLLMLKEGEPAELVPRVARVNDPGLQGRKIQVSRAVMCMAFDQHLSVLTSDAALDPRFQARDSIISAGIRSVMCVPLWTVKDVIGIIYADRIALKEPYTDEDLRLMTLLANLAAVKIENARLVEQALESERIEREIRLAAKIQRDFLPREIPSGPDYEIAAANIPCHEVGGDYYDFLDAGGGRLGLTVADVSGKGVGAALLMASLRASLHSEVRPDGDLAAMAARLNAFVQQSSAPEAFITFFYAVLCRETGRLDYVNAGHNPPLVFGRAGGRRSLAGTGLGLGMLPGQDYGVGTETIEPGEVLLLYTDGITESRDPGGEEFGVDRLAAVATERLAGSADEIQKAVLDALAKFTGGADPADDRTLVILKRLP